MRRTVPTAADRAEPVLPNLDPMTTPHTAFPADGYVARWQRWELDGDETLTLRWENEGWTAMGEVGHEKISYVVRISPTWHTRQFLLFRDLDEPDLWLGTDGAGRWGEVNGAHRPDLDGCHDVALTCTPFTRTLPIRRLQLDVGDAAELRAARVDVETLGVVPVRQRIEHLAPRRWRWTVDDGPPAEFDVDEYGLVHDDPPRFRRI
jgi:hypothetical protein